MQPHILSNTVCIAMQITDLISTFMPADSLRLHIVKVFAMRRCVHIVLRTLLCSAASGTVDIHSCEPTILWHCRHTVFSLSIHVC